MCPGRIRPFYEADEWADHNNEVCFGGPNGNCYSAVELSDRRKDGRAWKVGDSVEVEVK